MLLNEVVPVLVQYWPVVLASVVVLHFLRNKFNKGLNKYPGPPLAGWTNWWRFYDAYNRHTEQTHIRLHQKYGDIVRLGPNVIAIADPKAIKTIYGLNKGMTKVSKPFLRARSGGLRVNSLISTPFNKLLPEVTVSGPSSPPRMRIGMRNTGGASTVLSP